MSPSKKSAKRKPRPTRKPSGKSPAAAAPRDGFPVVAIGASAGGFEAMTELLGRLGSRTGMAFVLVQHLDPHHESLLSSLLRRSTSLPVLDAAEGMRVQPDHLYVTPPNVTLAIKNLVLRLSPREAQGRHSPIDMFCNSLAEDAGNRAIGIILSGTGNDGSKGLQSIKAAGGITFAQSESTAKHPEMPRNAMAAGAVDFELAPPAIAAELNRIGEHPYVNGALPGIDESSVGEDPGRFAKIFSLVRRATQVDFSYYKRATIRRRIARRMALHKIESLEDYVALLQQSSKEVENLYQDILIKVTSFFRDSAAFGLLKSKILPALVKTRTKNQPIRIWVPGCATGEEAFSMAITAVEYLSSLPTPVPCQIFATDLSETAVERARTGLYPESISADVSPERLRRFFTRVDGGYQIVKSIRDLCVIARQDLVKDPPFSKLDLISCRNVLIYLEPILHRKILPIFHYSLRPGGYLLLGASETVGSFSNLFSQVDRKMKLYQRRQTSVPVHFDLPAPQAPPEPAAAERGRPAGPVAREADVHREIDRIILNRFTPAGVVINADFEILQFRGQTDRYLQPSPGKASLNLLKMAREGLLFELRTAVQKARRDGATVRTQPISLSHRNETFSMRVDVVPLSHASPSDRQFLVLFEEIGTPHDTKSARDRMARKASEADRLLEQMRLELAATKEHLQSIIEEQETTNEELKSANEEILSSNEELQSTNEELETAKEELQSTNEELTTLNEELQVRNLELTQVNNDITNLLACVNIPIVMLGNDLRIRRFTPVAERLLNLIPTDIGRPVGDLKPNVPVPDLDRLIGEAIDSVQTIEREARDADGRWYLLRIRPYMTRDRKIEGAVLIYLDIDQHKRGQEQLGHARAYSTAILETVHDALVLVDADFRVKRANRAFYEAFQLSRDETEEKPLFEIDGAAWNQPAFRGRLQEVAAQSTKLQEFPLELRLSRLGPSPRPFRVNARRVETDGAPGPMILLSITPER